MTLLLPRGVPQQGIIRVPRIAGDDQLVGSLGQIEKVGLNAKRSAETGQITEFVLVLRSQPKVPIAFFLANSLMVRQRARVVGTYNLYRTIARLSYPANQELADALIGYGFRRIRS